MKFNSTKLAIALGLTWGLYVLLLGWIAALGWGNHNIVNALSGIYVGFKATFLGGIIGGLYGLVDGFIGGFIFATIYNQVMKKR